MIIVDGQARPFKVANFENLEQIIDKIMNDQDMHNRVVTDVLVNNEAFSEIYPHQAEDIETKDIERVEVISVSANEMALDIARELYKVVTLMGTAGQQVATHFRQANDGDALELYADLLEVNRDFLNMIGILKNEFALGSAPEFKTSLESLSALFSEMIEIQENEDWILLADLLEYEYLPLVETNKSIVAQLRQSMQNQVHHNA